MQDKRVKPTLLLYGRIPPLSVSQSASRPVGQSVLSAKHVSVAGFGSPYAPLRREKKTVRPLFGFPLGCGAGVCTDVGTAHSRTGEWELRDVKMIFRFRT